MIHVGLNAHLLSSQASYRAAGIHNVVDHLLRYLPGEVPADWQLTAMVGSRIQTRYAGVRIQRASLNTENPLTRIVWEQAVQPWHLRNFDLYHAMAFVSPLVNPTPTVVTVYDLTFMRYPERLSTSRRLYLRLLTHASCVRARRITAISHSTASDLTALLGIPHDRIDVTPLAYDEARFYPRTAAETAAFRQLRGLPERFWLFVGTIEPRKNLTMLLDAYAALPPNLRLPLVLGGGRGWGTDEVEARIKRHNLGGEVIMPGFIAGDELPLWYNNAEVFVYPSVFEGFGLPVLEAMACGTPVITTNVSSLPEVAQQAGMCLPPDDLMSWVNALRRAAQDSEWRSAARTRGLEEAKKFNWQTTAFKTYQSYRRALALPT
jgi:glycosyltransferase involved in cell wall biosynthesis